MALVGPFTRCRLCGELLGDRLRFATSGVWLPADHRLFELCDAALHWDCYAVWPDREQLARTFFEAGGWQGGRRVRILETEAVRVQVLGGPSPPPTVSLLLAATATYERVPLEGWESWLWRAPADDEGKRHPVQREAIRGVLPVLRAELPTADSVMRRIDWEELGRRHERFESELEAKRAAREARVAAKSRRTVALRAALDDEGLTCPHCSARRADHSYREPADRTRESFFICASCKRSFTAEELR